MINQKELEPLREDVIEFLNDCGVPVEEFTYTDTEFAIWFSPQAARLPSNPPGCAALVRVKNDQLQYGIYRKQKGVSAFQALMDLRSWTLLAR